ncbi:hypothetical protein H1R20_g5794, partial [Candolleomyces eurysporus]
MSKRAPDTPLSRTPKKKRPNPSGNSQLQLHHFFSSSPSKSDRASPVQSVNGVPSLVEPIDVDALDEKTSGPSVPPAARFESPQTPKPPVGKPVKTPIVFGSKLVKPEKLDFHPVDCDPVFYDPAAQPWTSTSAPYSFLAHALTTLSQTRSRIAIINCLTNTLRTIIQRHSSSLLPSLYLLSNTLSPAYVGVELGIGSSVLSKAIQQVSGLTAAALKQLYATTGDVGDVAYMAKSKVRTLVPHPPLTIQQVYDSLLKIASCKGQGAAKQKEKIVEKLLVAGSGDEVRYLVRTLTLNLRVGAVRTSILTALARAFVFHGSPGNNEDLEDIYASQDLLRRIQPIGSSSSGKKKEAEDSAREELKALFTKAEELVKQVYVRHPCYDDMVHALLQHGFEDLASRVPLSVGIPLHPTLGSPTRSLDEIYERLGNLPFTAEFKYDGQRAQIHAKTEANGKIFVKIFSRHLEDMTTKYPDIILLVEHLFKASPSLQSFILDSEIVAIAPGTGELKSFQELSNRPRKDVQINDIKVSVAVYVFDLLYCNSEIYLAKPFRARRERLRQEFPPYIPEDPTVARLCHVESCESDQGQEAVMDFWMRAVESKCEGLMLKVLDFEPEESTQPEEPGKSRRKILPATYEPDKRTLAWLKLKKDYVSQMPSTSHYLKRIQQILTPAQANRNGSVILEGSDQMFTSNLAKFGSITESPVSTAALGMVSDSRGLSVRFPRFIKVRVDKKIEQASTPGFLASMWRKQQKAPVIVGTDDGELIDVNLSEASCSELEDDESDAQGVDD